MVDLNPKISVIIPTGFRIAELQRCLQSCFEQLEFSSIAEVIVVFPQGDHKTHEFLKILGMKHSNLYAVKTNEKGANPARNLGAQRAAAPIIFFIDDDCYIPRKDYLREILEHFQADPQTLGCGGYYLTESNAPSHVIAYNWIANSWLLKASGAGRESTVLVGGCCAYRKKGFLLVGGFGQQIVGGGEEMSLNRALLGIGHVELADKFSVYHTFYGGLRKFFANSRSHGFGAKTSHGQTLQSQIYAARTGVEKSFVNRKRIGLGSLFWAALYMISVRSISVFKGRPKCQPIP